MGASVSKNISSSITKAIAKVSSEIIQSTQLSQNQAQIISVRNVHGDVHISGNKFTQKATINMKSLLDALSKEDSQQRILVELAQQAKSITSGLNLGQYADAQNIMNTLIEATTNLLTTIRQTCSAFSKQYQVINVKRAAGRVYITDNVFDEMYNILQNCSEKAVADSELIQDLTNKLSQSASATSEGLSGWILVALLATVLGLPIAGVIIGGTLFLKYIFPVILFIGVVLLVMYYVNVRAKEVMKLTGFSSFIRNTPSCLPTQIPKTLIQPESSIEASNMCLNNVNCKAFDWQIINIQKTGQYEVIPATANFYSNISDQCMKNIQPDNVSLLRSPVLFQGATDPNEILTAITGDIYLNTANGTWYQLVIGWVPMGIFTNNYNRISWGHNEPTIEPLIGVENDVYVHTDLRNPLYFYIYRLKGNVWQMEHKLRGPGLVPATPPKINTSGFKQLQRPKWMLYAGIICVVVGMVGTVFTMKK